MGARGVALRRAIILVLVLLVPSTFPAAAAEGPVDERCDGSGVLVCAGANAGAQVSCAMVGPTSAACSYTRGQIWNAYSPLQLGGEADVVESAVVSVCLAGACESTTYAEETACAWLPAAMCEGGGMVSGSVGPFELGMGHCLVVSVAETLGVSARATAGPRVLAAAEWADTGDAAGAVCRVDDGRG